MLVELAKVIEVYVKNRKELTISECRVLVDEGHAACAGSAPGITCKEESVLSDIDKQVIKTAKAIAKEKGMKVKVYNLSTTLGKLKARFKGVEKSPTILVGDKRIDGEIDRDSVLNALD
jgi:hypothetical protein